MFFDTGLNPYPDSDCNGSTLEGLTECERADMLRHFDRDMEELRFYAFTSGRHLTSVDNAEFLIMRRDRKDLLMVGCLGDDVLKANLDWARNTGRRGTRAVGRRRRGERISDEGRRPSIGALVREVIDGINNGSSPSSLSE